MKVLTKDKNKSEMSELIQAMFSNSNPIISWETNLSGKRTIAPVKLSNIFNEEGIIAFTTADSKAINFQGTILFFFSEDQKIIFKAKINQLDGGNLRIELPEEIKLLDESDDTQFSNLIDSFQNGHDFDQTLALGGSGTGKNEQSGAEIEDGWYENSMSVHDIDLFKAELASITLEDEDKIYEGMRTSPRSKPPEGKMVLVQPASEARAQSSFLLYDLSQGGFSFLVFSKEEFSIDEHIVIKAFDTKKFDVPMKGIVKSIREADDLGVQYKVGCMFVSEQ